MKYFEDYIYSKDIDWFFTLNGVNIHVASAGGMIPDVMNDREKLRSVQKAVFNFRPLYKENQIIRNIDFITYKLGIQDTAQQERYFSSFVEMSMKGFISLDRTNINNPYDNTYHVVCMPPELKHFELNCTIYKSYKSFTFSTKMLDNIDLLELI